MFWNPGFSYLDINARATLIFYAFLFNIFLFFLRCFFERFSIFPRTTQNTREKKKTMLLEEIETYKKLCKVYDTKDSLIDYVKSQRILCDKQRELQNLQQSDPFSRHATSPLTFLSSGDSKSLLSFLLLSKAFSVGLMFLLVKIAFPPDFSKRLGIFDVSGAFFISQTAQHHIACCFRKIGLKYSSQSDKKNL